MVDLLKTFEESSIKKASFYHRLFVMRHGFARKLNTKKFLSDEYMLCQMPCHKKHIYKTDANIKADTKKHIYKTDANIKTDTGGVLSKKMLLKIPQNSQENTCARVSF